MKTVAEIMQFCVLNGISVLCQKPAEGEEVLVKSLPTGVPSVTGLLGTREACEIAFTAQREDGRPAWHVVVSADLASDMSAFEEAFREGFDTFCRLAGIAPRPPQTLFGFPAVDAKVVDISPFRQIPMRQFKDLYEGTWDSAKDEEDD